MEKVVYGNLSLINYKQWDIWIKSKRVKKSNPVPTVLYISLMIYCRTRGNLYLEYVKNRTCSSREIQFQMSHMLAFNPFPDDNS